jgi:serine/threonine protein kinase
LNLPHIVLKDHKFDASIGRCFLGDGVDFTMGLTAESPYTVRQMLTALLNVLYGLNLLTTNGYAHSDIKPDNFLWKLTGEENQLTFCLSDFSHTRTFSDIIKENAFVRAIPRVRLVDDCRALEKYLYGSRIQDRAKSEKQIYELIEKQEVYAFGASALEMMTTQCIPSPNEFLNANQELMVMVYGQPVFDFFSGCLCIDHKDRFTFKSAIAELLKILKHQSKKYPLLEGLIFKAAEKIADEEYESVEHTMSSAEFDQEDCSDTDITDDLTYFVPNVGSSSILDVS